MQRILGVLLFLGTPIAASAAPPPANTSVSLENTSEIVADAKQKAADADRLKQMLEMREAIQSASHDRLEIIGGWLGVIVGMFGALITVIVVFFGLRLEQAALARAEKSLADAREQFDRRMVATLLKAEEAAEKASQANEKAEEALTTAQSHAERAKAHSRDAEEDARKLRKASALAKAQSRTRPEESPTLSVEDQQTLAEGVVVAKSTPPSLRTASAFRVQLLGARMANRWREVIEIAREFRTAHADDDESVTMALMQEGIAHYRLEEWEQALECHDELLDRYERKPKSVDREDYLITIVNKSSVLFRQKKFVEANQFILKSLETVIQSDYDDYGARVNSIKDALAATLNQIGRADEAKKLLDNVIVEFEKDHSTLSKMCVGNAYYNRACSAALLKDTRDSIRWLKKWSSSTGGFDCNAVALDSDFDGIRDDKPFLTFLGEKGCPPPG
ncbi:MAG: hypothetical protein V4574_10810 [Pseudomonadota bacterium]